MAKPKLALIPSGVADNQVFSVLPSNGDGDFNFTRGTVATRINKDGLIENVAANVPRLNYPLLDGKVVGCPSLLLENSATNLFTYSEDFSNSYWTKGIAIITSGFISPDGTLNAFKLVEGTNNGFHGFYQNANVIVPNGKITMSIFVKANGRDYFQLRTGSAAGITGAPLYANFDLTNNSVTASSSGVDDSKVEVFNNDWKRISISFTVASGSQASLVFQPITTNSASIGEIYQGDGTSGFYIFGAQVEQGSYPTSYIPTNGSTVTRLAETCNGAGTSDTFSDSEGVLMIETSGLADDGTVRRIGIGDNRTYNVDRMSIGYTNSNNDIQFFLKVNGVNQFSELFTVSNIKENNKVAFKYGLNSCSFWINGIKVGENLTNDIFSVDIINYLNFNSYNSFNPFYGNTKQIQYFDTTDIDLEQLTSWVSFQEMAEAQLYSIE